MDLDDLFGSKGRRGDGHTAHHRHGDHGDDHVRDEYHHDLRSHRGDRTLGESIGHDVARDHDDHGHHRPDGWRRHPAVERLIRSKIAWAAAGALLLGIGAVAVVAGAAGARFVSEHGLVGVTNAVLEAAKRIWEGAGAAGS